MPLLHDSYSRKCQRIIDEPKSDDNRQSPSKIDVIPSLAVGLCNNGFSKGSSTSYRSTHPRSEWYVQLSSAPDNEIMDISQLVGKD